MSFTLANGIQLPKVGFGTYKALDQENIQVLLDAFASGYTYFDSASFYGTECFLAEAMQKGKIDREKVMLASKVWKNEMGYEATKQAFQNTLNRLRTDYLDVYLIHWPRPTLSCDWKTLVLETWQAMEELYDEGRMRAIGVSNFLPQHLEVLRASSRIQPMIDQLEFHPGYTQEACVQYCKQHHIQVQAWSPIGRARVLQEPLICELAEKYQVFPAQICLRFALQKGVMPLPKSSSLERMKQNRTLDFTISQEDMYRLDTLPQTGWSGEHPDFERVQVK